ncbi:GDSL-type esterase/lipase family protein [Microbacterium amylolyticum]|uniref:D-inositol 3-phosphate glycosyltransferase n=1 Tax=Microbacterium amylolyticum TaxID=936337 RepID=A0ABS4ZFV3_9MICO|nr:GDSL-type esterase/lipase family protein [Microbacterium amylolyticum]MBP2436167.1 phosphatidylinositol alpha 1,6-mannosyltransferase [Microbacterium amylolyticum]
MRVAIVAESFLPHMNGVTNSVLQVVHHLEQMGHDVLVVAPKAPGQPDTVAGVDMPRDTALLASVALPSYPDVRVALAPVAQLKKILSTFRPDVVHLASPAILGWQGLIAADGLGLPTVAIYQTDIIAYTAKYGVPAVAALAEAHVARLHRRATMSLVPSTTAEKQLAALEVDRMWRWGRGVDAERFAPERRDAAWRQSIAPSQKIIGYVGRLAPEKQVEDLRALNDIDGARLVIVGDGPERARLERELPGAHFAGFLSGDALGTALASFDVFVHPGESETFCQTVQEALSSGVPVVATGAGGPVDLVRSSIDGWLYAPGDLDDMRVRVQDLLGDEAKRRSFGAAARASVSSRTWLALTQQLLDHYAEATRLRAFDASLMARSITRPASPVRATKRPTWRRFVALGDSLTEGLNDTSRMANGQLRGWADRLATMLAEASGEDFRYANLAVRSRRIRDLTDEQVPAAIALQPDLVAIFMGSNDLIGHLADAREAAAELEANVAAVRRTGADVLLVTPFLPRRPAARVFAKRFGTFAHELRRIAREHGAFLVDAEALPELSSVEMFADDRVHLRSRGHRLLSYRAAEILGIPDAVVLSDLDDALHRDDDDQAPPAPWLTAHALPWVWRRLHGRTAGDGLSAKHADYVVVPGRRRDSAREGQDVPPPLA